MRRMLRQLGWAAAAWTAVGLLSWARDPLFALSVGRPPPPLGAGLATLVNCWIWAALTPPMLWLAARFPLDRRSWPRSLPVHLMGGLASVLASAVATFLLVGKAYAGAPTLGAEVAAELFIDLFSYAAVVALGHALAYHRQSAEQRVRSSQLEAQLLSAQLEALEARLDPHFLFNALNTVSSLVRTGDADAAVRAVARLGDLLRALLQRDPGQEVALSQELDFVGRYLELERARFGDRLTTAVEVAPELLEAQVPRLVLQPLVENALRHGIEPSAAAGRVEVRAVREGEMLRLEVRDSGGAAAGPRREGGVGLAGMRARLARLYGDRQELSLASGAGGTVARVRLPFHTGARAGAA